MYAKHAIFKCFDTVKAEKTFNSLLFIFIILIFSLISCTAKNIESAMETDISAETNVIAEYNSSTSIHLLTSMEEAAEKADYIVICTATNIGETYLNGNPTLPDTGADTIEHSKKVSKYVNSIRTPVTLHIDKVLYDSAGELGETLILTEKGGTYNGYTLITDFLNYEVDHIYLMFIGIAPDGVTNICSQGSAELFIPEDNKLYLESNPESISFRPIIPTAVYDNLESLADITVQIENALTALASKK